MSMKLTWSAFLRLHAIVTSKHMAKEIPDIHSKVNKRLEQTNAKYKGNAEKH